MNLYSAFSINIFKCTLQARDQASSYSVQVKRIGNRHTNRKQHRHSALLPRFPFIPTDFEQITCNVKNVAANRNPSSLDGGHLSYLKRKLLEVINTIVQTLNERSSFSNPNTLMKPSSDPKTRHLQAA